MNRHERTYAFPRTTANKLTLEVYSRLTVMTTVLVPRKKTALPPLARQQFDVRSTNTPICASKITPIALRLFSASFLNHFCRTYGQFTSASRGNPNAFRDFPHARYDAYLAPKLRSFKIHAKTLRRTYQALERPPQTTSLSKQTQLPDQSRS